MEWRIGPVCDDVDALVAELIGRLDVALGMVIEVEGVEEEDVGFAEIDDSEVVAVLFFLRVSVCRRLS